MSKSGKASRCSSALVDRSKLLPSICGAERADLATKLLDNEQVLSKEIICILEGEEEISGRRKEILHKRWDENVYQPIQDQINRKLNAEYDSFLERKINIYDQYLNVVNKKSICNSKNHVFLDVISPEYDALNLQRNSLRALIKTNGKDPLFVHQRKNSRDFYLLNQNPRERRRREAIENELKIVNFPGQSLAKNELWKSVMISNIESLKRQKSQRRMNPDKLTDQLDDPNEVDLTDGIKKQFPEERAVTFIKPVLHCES